jgi:riboflavin synthase
MFTGIIETLATVTEVISEGSNRHFWLSSSITHELKVDQSVAHDGVCLTVVAIQNDTYKVTAVAETLSRTTLAHWLPGRLVNMERSLLAGSRLDGHLVQGHADATAVCTDKQVLTGSWLYRFRFPEQYAALVIEKGSICINGISLTAYQVSLNELTVTVIPYTFEHTNINSVDEGTLVNIEFDVLGKYILRSREVDALLAAH